MKLFFAFTLSRCDDKPRVITLQQNFSLIVFLVLILFMANTYIQLISFVISLQISYTKEAKRHT